MPQITGSGATMGPTDSGRCLLWNMQAHIDKTHSLGERGSKDSKASYQFWRFLHSGLEAPWTRRPPKENTLTQVLPEPGCLQQMQRACRSWKPCRKFQPKAKSTCASAPRTLFSIGSQFSPGARHRAIDPKPSMRQQPSLIQTLVILDLNLTLPAPAACGIKVNSACHKSLHD